MTTTTATAAVVTCDPATSTTKSLLGYGVLAGPLYVAVSLGQALTRDGFDLTRHPWSLLSNGALGWLQITNFVVTGLMVIAFAAGMRRALRPGRGATWVPRLVAVYGASLIGAGVFRADPALGFPVGTPETATGVSWHGVMHFASGGIGFLCLIVACQILARRYAADGRGGRAVAASVVGVLFLGAFVGIASGTASSAITLTFVGAVVIMWTWIAVTAVDLYRRASA